MARPRGHMGHVSRELGGMMTRVTWTRVAHLITVTGPAIQSIFAPTLLGLSCKV